MWNQYEKHIIQKKSIAMNKLFVGLLVIAAGVGVFFLLRKKKDTPSHPIIKKEDIVGKWKTDPRGVGTDSNSIAYNYDFRDEGIILQSVNDSVKADTSHYSLNAQNELVWKEKLTD